MANDSPRQEGRDVHYARCGGLTCPCYYDGFQAAGDPSVMQDDLRELLDALDLGTHARPVSPHQVMAGEVIPAVKALVADAATMRAR